MNISPDNTDPGSQAFSSEETPAPEAPEAPATAGNPEQPPQFASTSSAKFFHWIRDLGVQRGPNRWMGGVCSGLATKWNIDPVIVRGLAVVLTLFFGLGLLAYGVAWALLPEPDGRMHAEEVARGRWSAGTTGATVLTVLGLAGPGQGLILGGEDSWFPWPLFWMAAVAALIYWGVNYNTAKKPLPGGGQPPETGPLYANTPPPAPTGTASPGTSYYAPQAFVPNPQMYVKYQPVKSTPRLGAAASVLVLGMAAVVGAVVLILDATGVFDFGGYQAGMAAAAAAITAGVAIVIAGIVGRSASGVGTFAIIALVFAVTLSLPAQTGPFTSFNNSTWVPATVGAAEAGRTVVMGNATFDLTVLDDETVPGSELNVPLKTVLSRVTLKVPADVPVTINSELAAVSLVIDGEDSGGTLTQDMTTELNPEATGSGIVINLESVASNIDIVTVK